MPEVLAGATEAAIQTWLVAVGDAVGVGQALAEIETDKATVELSAEIEGTIGRLLVRQGDNVAVGEPIMVMTALGEGVDAIERALAAAGAEVAAPAAPEPVATPAPAPAVPAAGAAASPVQADGGRLFASPLVRRLAAQQGIEIAEVSGTGPNGRIVRRDLERHLSAAVAVAPPAAPSSTPPRTANSKTESADYVLVPLDRMRKAIARRLTESKATVPHFYLVADCRVEALLALRAEINATSPRRISVNDFVLKAVAGALMDVPSANAIWNEEGIRQFSSAEISVAVATDGGLTTPVLRGVERMSLSAVSASVADLAERARTGRLKQHELEGGSFSVSNLGMYGTSQFTAILNPPQSGILAVGASRKMPVVDANGDVIIAPVMTVTLSADHRVLDGAVAAELLAAFQRRVENPLTMLT